MIDVSKSIVHFGIKIPIKTRGIELTRENYATISNKSSLGKNYTYIQAQAKNDEMLIESYSKIYADKEGLIYRDDWCMNHLTEVMQNYDLNMEFFMRLNQEKFNNEIEEFLKKTDFIETNDLSEYSCPGYYALILDKYCQIYIGTSKDIKARIRQHWTGGKLKFDRLIFGGKDTSKISIDSFRTLDTTRVLVYPTDDIFNYENEYINMISDKFLCNRVGGGKVDDMECGLLNLMVSMKNRKMK